MDPRISVVVPNMNGMEHLPDCFRSLAAAAYPLDRQEWILSDNGSHDGSPEYIARAYPRTRIVQNGGNVGFARGCNAGAQAATGEYVVFLNNDTRVHPDWLRGYLRALARDPDAVCAASYMRSWDDREPDFDGASANLFGVGRQRAVAGWPDAPAGPGEGDPLLFACGGAMLVHRATFLAVGGFDPSFFIYFEDVDLGWRLWVLGHRVVYAPGSIVYHKEGGTTGARRAPSHRRYLLFEANTLAALVKNYEQATLDRVLPAALLLEWNRALRAAGDVVVSSQWSVVGDESSVVSRQSSVTETETQQATLGTQHSALGTPLPPLSVAHLLALGQLVERWPQLMADRARIQGARKRPDSAILPLFGRPFQPQFAGAAYADTMRRISAALDLYPLVASASPSRILIFGAADGPSAERAVALEAVLGGEFLVRRAGTDAAALAPTADLLLAAAGALPAIMGLAPDVPLAADVAALAPESVPATVRAALERRAGLLICANPATAAAWRAVLPALAVVVQPAGAPLAPALRQYCRYPLHST